MARTTARPASAMSTIFAGGRLRSGVAISCVTLMPTPGPRSRPGGFGATGVGSDGAVGGLGVSSGMRGLEFGFYAGFGEKSQEGRGTLPSGGNRAIADRLSERVRLR